jgi:hypothetical protein
MMIGMLYQVHLQQFHKEERNTNVIQRINEEIKEKLNVIVKSKYHIW